MNENLHELFQDTLALETWVPLTYTVMERPLLNEELWQLNKSNEELMQTIHLLDEAIVDSSDGQTGQESMLLRLEHKVNVLMGMVSQLLMQQMEMPERVRLRLNAYALEWHEPRSLPGHALPLPGQSLLVTLYLHAALPQPVRLIGEVKQVEPGEEGVLIRLQLQGLGDSTSNALERFVFRHHRRAIAQSRPAQ